MPRPALLTQTSMLPNCAIARSRSSSLSRARVTSAGTASALIAERLARPPRARRTPARREHDPRAALDDRLGERRADARRRAGDDDDLVLHARHRTGDPLRINLWS